MAVEPLNLFPTRAAIGRADASGAVYMTPEFSRALAQLLVRVGGPTGTGTDDLALEIAQSNMAAIGQALAQDAADLQRQAVELMGQFAVLAELRKALETLERVAVEVAPPPDWEHPGKIGAATPNSGAFTTLNASAKVQLNPAGQNVEIKPTGAALLTIQPAAVGQIDNMELGKTAPAPARVTTLNKLTFTQPATGATLNLADGVTFGVNASLILNCVAGAVLNINTGGTLGTAAFTNSTAYAARSATALGAAATDAASTQTLVNTIRSVLLSVGIGS